ncbi:MAG TPA: pyridoxamine 5'-phosphate oxidase family protein [Mycobacteriales bacterium]|nr:pyridoxamine 5'-phosphate oxidase family protein [Mycobacteriales bacterium]
MSPGDGGRLDGMRSKNLGELYDLPLVDWTRVTDRLAQGLTLPPGTGGPDHHTIWLVTTNDDGSPHVNGIGAVWVDDTFWFCTGATSRKGRNLARDPRCAMSLATSEMELVVEGTAERVTNHETVARLCARWADEWPCTVDESGEALTAPFSAPSAGPPPWAIYRMTLTSAHALTISDPAGATRWDFD